MQDVTTLPFMRVVTELGPPDYFFTEYFRVYAHSRLIPYILSSITENPSGRPVFAQLIGEDLEALARTARELQAYAVAGVDLNLGCPAPKVYKKNVGGGLLRDPEHVNRVLGTLREACPGRFTVKMRIGFDSTEHYETLLGLVNKHGIDLLSVHGRTVKEMYRGGVHYDFIRQAVQTVRCPVLANGNITSVPKARAVLAVTGAAGVMVGRSAIRNPWIFRQLREAAAGEKYFRPTLADVRDYIDRLWQATLRPGSPPKRHIAYLKKFLNFVGQSVDPESSFLKAMRRAQTPDELFAICDEHLLADGAAERAYAEEPYSGVIARPNHEGDPCEPEQGCSL
ncbi:tRNA-dihydrouridine synthase family protein [Ruficoccus amylovorans]|uniref:tRNA-dihydrouridine synthase n=2 Tax=Ruficoccus amylovorans TaxID=1804625 RepID=A0A842HJP1_9BACT|nr:tRNA-dihydrouridine synthase family protein [Ruficoccus amylovorans]MBC2596340.1 tRNA-dihydrouridine synthase family protein [Ruficoccus amylovorans]